MEEKKISTQEPNLTMETDASMLSGMPGCTDRRILVSNRAEEPHQLSGTPHSLVWIESISQGQEEHPYPSEDGHQDSSVLREPDGGNTFPSTE